MKVLTMYLPQFHAVRENSEWWGEGYTEWHAVKSAEVLFDGHKQPIVPLGQNYYDLMDRNTMLWQAELMHRYGIGGQCFYHYYFKDGRKILEKPAENLLRDKEINMPFCFCWANETWARTWSRLQGANAWGSKFEKKQGDTIDHGILLKQDYGREALWKEHFYYLLPFFKDDRYIKYQNRPMFLIYKPTKINCLYQMKSVWNRLAQKEGIDPVYIIGINSAGLKTPGVDKILHLGPEAYFLHLNQDEMRYDKDKIHTYDYSELCSATVDYCTFYREDAYYSVVTGYDDTPRRGRDGYCITGARPDLFEQCLMAVMGMSKKCGNEYIFVNAWNEWGEGMHLEPDEKDGYQYLEAIKKCVDKIDEYDVSNFEAENEFIHEELRYLKRELYRQNCLRDMLEKVLQSKMKQRQISLFLNEKGHKNIAIYGYGVLGKYLVSDLADSGINIEYIVEKMSNNSGIISLDQFLTMKVSLDAVIITPILDFNTIADAISEKIRAPIYSAMEIVDYLYDEV